MTRLSAALAGAAVLLLGFATLAQTLAPAARRPSFEVSVGPGPFLATVDGAHHAVFELHVTNFASRAVHLDSVISRTSDGASAAELSGPALDAALWIPGAEPGAALGPGQRAVIYLWEAVDAGLDLRQDLEHRITYREEGSPSVNAARATTAGTAPGLPELGPPLRGGPWIAVYLPMGERGHRRVIYAMEGRARIPGRFAIDFFRIDHSGRGYQGERDVVANWTAVGLEVLAVADGRVVEAISDFPQAERLSDGPPYTLTWDTAAGNTVVLDIGGGRYAFYEHLAPGSVRVAEGDVVRRGQVIGAVGLTGQGSKPHLHFHVADGPDHLRAEGLPYRLTGARVLGRYGSDVEVGEQQSWAPPGPGDATMVRGLPAPYTVLEFPDVAT